MLPVTSLLYDWFWFLRRMYYILYFRDGNIVLPGIIILFIRRSRISVSMFTWGWTCYWHTSLYSGVYKYFLVILSPKFLRRFDDFPGMYNISSYIRMSILVLVFLISFEPSDSVLLLNKLLAGLLAVIVNCCAYRPLYILLVGHFWKFHKWPMNT